jgi:hypothetical protein
MGRVYKARHLALDRDVAVKVVDRSAEGPAPDAAFTEARAAAKLEDPRIVAVYEVGEDRGYGFIVMQWVDGESLESRVRRAGPLPPDAALAVARDVAGALAVAHAAGIVHRDVKPANVLLDSRGAAKLSDFGLAAATGEAAAGGAAIGSYHFMPPEQSWGAAPDPRMDLYALGGTWYYALTGHPPFDGSAGDVVTAHREKDSPDVRRRRPELTGRTASLIRRLLEKDPARRPAGAAELARELADSGLLLDVDDSGSPFALAAPPVPTVAPADVPAAPAPFAKPAPRPLPAATPSALGSRVKFDLLLALFGLVAIGWSWRRAGPEDWAAACAVGCGAPLLLTLGERRTSLRRALGAGIWCAALASAAVYARGRGAAAWALETLIVGGFGVVASGGAVYLGYWGTNTEEVFWARALAPAGAALLTAAELTWSFPEGRAWPEVLASEAARAWSFFSGSGGLWRWGALVLFAGALMATRRLRTSPGAKPTDRRLNWTA